MRRNPHQGTRGPLQVRAPPAPRPGVGERVTLGPEGPVRTDLKRPFADGTVAADLDPLSLLCRLADSVPAPGTHTVRYAGVLASASRLRPRIVPKAEVAAAEHASEAKPKRQGCRYRSWALQLATLGIDAFECPRCQGRMRLLALVRAPNDVRRSPTYELTRTITSAPTPKPR